MWFVSYRVVAKQACPPSKVFVGLTCLLATPFRKKFFDTFCDYTAVTDTKFFCILPYFFVKIKRLINIYSCRLTLCF